MLRLRCDELEAQHTSRYDRLNRTTAEAVEILKSSQPRQDIVASNVQEIKELLLRPHSPIPTYFSPPSYSLEGSPTPPPRLLLPGQSIPLAHRDLNISSTPLHEAARNGDIRAVRQALNISKIDANALDDEGRTALHIACAEGHFRIVQFLLSESKAALSIEDLSGARPLHRAAASGNAETVRYLLTEGAKDDKPDDAGLYARDYARRREDELISWILRAGLNEQDPLEPSGMLPAVIHFTAVENVDAVKYFLDSGASTADVKDSKGFTALMHASHNGNAAIAQLLCSSGTSTLDYQLDDGSSALIIAAHAGHVDVLRALLSHGPNLELKTRDRGYTALTLAVLEGHFEAAGCLCDAGASLESPDNWSLLPLHRAAHFGKTDAMTWLLEAGAYIDARKEDRGWTALHEACEFKRPASVKVLFDYGASTELRDGVHGVTALSLAANGACNDIIDLLIAHGANLNHMDSNGRTPLAEAAARGHTSTVRLLLERGAYVDTRDHEDFTPLLKASQRSYYEIIEMLLARGADPTVRKDRQHMWTPLHEIVRENRLDIAQLLLDKMLPAKKAKLDTKNDYGYTALGLAASYRNFAFVKLLVKVGADVNTLMKNKWTPLDEAAHYGQYEMAVFLLDNGAWPDGGFGEEGGDWGWTPLMRATRAGHLQVCKLLIERGADITLKTQQNRTALTIAREFGREDILMYLSEIENNPQIFQYYTAK